MNTTTKVLLLDADGLVLKSQRYFSSVYAEEHNVPLEVILSFFKTRFKECQQGTADLKQELLPVLGEWKWKGTVDELLEYWFSSCTEIDKDTLKIIGELREKGIRCYLASNQEKYRGEYIKKNLELENHVDGFFYSYELGHLKSEPDFFEAVLRKLGDVDPAEILFLDNDERNVQVAKESGIGANVFKSSEDLLINA